MKKYKIEIVGCQPVIWNVMKRELELEKKELKKDQLSEWEEDKKNWSRKAELDKAGNVIIPDRWFKNAMIESCKKNRIIPHFATRKNETYTNYVRSCVVLNCGGALCKKKDLVYDGAYVSINNSKIWRVRPKMENWSATFEIIDPAARMKVDELEEMITYAGMMVGIGDNRINNLGRFDIKKIVEVN